MLIENLGRERQFDPHDPRNYSRGMRPHIVQGSFTLPSGKKSRWRDVWCFKQKAERDEFLRALPQGLDEFRPNDFLPERATRREQ